MKIVHIRYPYIITDTGEKIDIIKIQGLVRMGSELVLAENGMYHIRVSTNDGDCVNGVCPVK